MYMANNFVLNPAVAGIEPYTDIKLGTRLQWVGLTDAPRTVYATVNSPLQSYYGRNGRLGGGAKLIVDETGPIRRSSAELSLAYHLPVTDVFRVAVGVGAGINHQRLDWNRIILENAVDPLNYADVFSYASPAANFGFWFYSDDFFIGAAAHNLIGGTFTGGLREADALQMPVERHYFMTTGYRFQFGDFYLTPSAMVKVVRPAPLSVDINMKGQVSDVAWAGLSWRRQDGVAAMIGFFASRFINVAYSYDFIQSDLRRHTSGSHEIILGIVINNERGPKCPTIIW